MAFGRIKSNAVLVLATSVTTCLLLLGCLFGLTDIVVVSRDISKAMKPSEMEPVTAFRYNRNIRADQIVAEEDLVKVQIPRVVAEHVGRLLDEEMKAPLAVGRKINRYVVEGEFVMMQDFADWHIPGPEDDMAEHKVQMTIRIDSENTSGTSLRVGNYVNVLGMLPTKQGTYKTYRIIEWLRVVAIDGQTDRRDSFSDTPSTTRPGVRSIKTIAVEVQRKFPDVSLQWSNLKTYLKGPAFIEICPSISRPKKGMEGVIAPELLPFTTRASAVSTSEFEVQDF